MEYYEMIMTSFLYKDVYFNEANEVIAKIINKAMLLDKELSDKHQKNEFKFYSFDTFQPTEADKIYKKGRIYIFKIRTLDKLLANKIRRLIQKANNENLKIISCEMKTKKKKHIVELFSITPTLITLNNKHWLPNDNFILLQKQLQGNLEKKYKSFYGEQLNVTNSFIQHIEILNRKVISIKYKNTRLLGNKFRIIINDDDVSQKLAFIAEVTGLGEKSSSAGMGYCNAQYLK